jgi:glycine dehydrogenase subunit 2
VRFARPAQPVSTWLPQSALRKTPPRLPELSEFDVVRHYTRLSRLNYCLDTHLYPLGSCTMKYNPRANEEIAALDGFAAAHPAAPDAAAQGTLEILWRLEKMLCALTGLAAFTLQPAAGAHGEFTGILIAAAYHRSRRDRKRTEILVADSSHGTNPASAALGGFAVKTVASRRTGGWISTPESGARTPDGHGDADGAEHPGIVRTPDPGDRGRRARGGRAALHGRGELQRADGAGEAGGLRRGRPAPEPAQVVFDAARRRRAGLRPRGRGCRAGKILPVPRVTEKNGKFALKTPVRGSIGRVRSWAGNVGVALKAYAYLRGHDAAGLRSIAENAILNANYARAKLKDLFPPAVDEACLHECVLQTEPEKLNGIKTLDVAKRLLDFGFYAPTIYFPLIVHEALMIEPTETESKETLDAFVEALRAIHAEAQADPERVHSAPHELPVKRLDELAAARNPNVAWG